MSDTLLAIEGLEAGYEPGAAIVRGVSLDVKAGEIVTILGPNGAGKSTLIKAVAGLVPKFAGLVKLGDADITREPAHLLARQGLGFVPQTENVFTLMSITDNLRLAADILPKPERAAKIEEMLRLFPDLDRQRQLAAGRLSGGQRQMLAVARALIASPRLLMLDEASAGLSPASPRIASRTGRDPTGSPISVFTARSSPLRTGSAWSSRAAASVRRKWKA